MAPRSNAPLPGTPETAGADAATDQERWNAAYLRFESPEDEIRKFVGRLRAMGADAWSREARVVELFCGRGNGLHALARMGFSHLTGVDLSPPLASVYSGPARIIVADCRELPLAAASADIAIVQGGLHHLPHLPEDLDRTVREVRRVMGPAGRFVIVEPWRTPFLDVVHAASRSRLARRLSAKLDAFATMVHYERDTYERWLASPALILDVLERHFPRHERRAAWGKLSVVAHHD